MACAWVIRSQAGNQPHLLWFALVRGDAVWNRESEDLGTWQNVNAAVEIGRTYIERWWLEGGLVGENAAQLH